VGAINRGLIAQGWVASAISLNIESRFSVAERRRCDTRPSGSTSSAMPSITYTTR